MKVNIGPYVDEGDRIEEIHIDNYDTWSMDHTLALIVLPMLKQLKDTKHGAPNVDSEDVPENLRMPDGWYDEKYSRDGETDPNFFKRWDYVINEMIFAFQSKKEDWSDMFFSDEEPPYKRTKVEFKGIGPAQLRLFPDDDGSVEDYNMYEWVSGTKEHHFDKEGYTKYQDRITNGFRLFGKYFESLWD